MRVNALFVKSNFVRDTEVLMITEIGRNYLWVSKTGEESESQLIDRCDPLVDLRVTLNDKKLFFELLEVAYTYYVTPIIYECAICMFA